MGKTWEKDLRFLEGGHVVKDFWQGEIEETKALPSCSTKIAATAYNKNLVTLTCNGVPVRGILPALGYF